MLLTPPVSSGGRPLGDNAQGCQYAFDACVSSDAGINLAEAALQVAAEDDAIVSHSTVRLPIQSFLQRIDRLASNMRSAVLQKMPEDATPDDILEVRKLT